jgi:hypothetical protein
MIHNVGMNLLSVAHSLYPIPPTSTPKALIEYVMQILTIPRASVCC